MCRRCTGSRRAWTHFCNQRVLLELTFDIIGDTAHSLTRDLLFAVERRESCLLLRFEDLCEFIKELFAFVLLLRREKEERKKREMNEKIIWVHSYIREMTNCKHFFDTPIIVLLHPLKFHPVLCNRLLHLLLHFFISQHFWQHFFFAPLLLPSACGRL